MQKEKIKAIGMKKKVKDLETFVAFISKRFPEEFSVPYVEEWADRFNTGKPEGYMDIESLTIYKGCLDGNNWGRYDDMQSL